MADQATMTNGRNAAPASEMTRNVSGLASDISTLAELQGRLFALDAKQSARKLIVPLVLTLLGVVFLLGSIPVLLMGVAYLLTDLGMDGTAALFVAFAIGLVIGALGVGIGWALLRHSLDPFQRSRNELVRNLQWIKSALTQSSQAVANTERT